MVDNQQRADSLEAGGNDANRNFGNATVGQTVAPCEPDAEVALDERPEDIELELSMEMEDLPALEVSTEVEEVSLEVETELS